MTHADPVAAAARHALAEGDLEISGRIMPASNATFYAEAVLGDLRVPCVYKPTAGERPLWDFPDGTLAGRERAAYLVSDALGWDVVPLTLLRDGPVGPGMVQQWQEPAPDCEAVDLCPQGEVPAGWLHVLDALDGAGQPVSLVHEDTVPLRRMAVFDVLINNADRKGGHVLAMADGHRYGVDHGICFHEDDKLRTVLWGWGRRPLVRDDRDPVGALGHLLATSNPLNDELATLLTPAEVAALGDRVERLLRANRMPVPSGAWPSIPWPAF